MTRRRGSDGGAHKIHIKQGKKYLEKYILHRLTKFSACKNTLLIFAGILDELYEIEDNSVSLN